jgi:hypothetical protein
MSIACIHLKACPCWKLDEDSIQFWHGTDEGFANRKAINTGPQ